MQDLKDRMKQARVYAGYSQKALAIRAAVTQQMISALERGNTTSCRELRSLAKACGVDFEWLETGIGDMISGHKPVAVPDLSRLMGIAHLTAAKQSLLAGIACFPPHISTKESVKLLEGLDSILSRLASG